MRALITGITGFAGSHLAEYLLSEQPEVEVFGTHRWRSRMENIAHLEGRIVTGVMRTDHTHFEGSERGPVGLERKHLARRAKHHGAPAWAVVDPLVFNEI